MKESKESKFRVEIDLGNDAMSSLAHVARAVQNVAADLWAESTLVGESTFVITHGDIFDVNGNSVGSWSFRYVEDDTEEDADD